MQIGNVEIFESQLSSGKGAFLTGPLDAETAEVLSQLNITELQIGASVIQADLSFIDVLKDLEMLFIEVPVTKGLKKVEQLSNLKGLFFSSITPDETAIAELDFSKLKDVAFGIPGLVGGEAYLRSKEIQSLSISNAQLSDLSVLSALTSLRSLTIYSSEVTSLEGIPNIFKLNLTQVSSLSSLRGLETCSNLLSLTLDEVTELQSIDEIGKTTAIRDFLIQRCFKIHDVSALENCTQLQNIQFNVCGKIESLKPLRNFTHLKTFNFSETTVIVDGDISFLKEFKELKSIKFMNRKHYNMTTTEWYDNRFPGQTWTQRM